MVSHKRLNSVSHSIAHHAVSSLSYVHPHLRQAAKACAKENVCINLLAVEHYPRYLPEIIPLKCGLVSLKQRFIEILESENFSKSELKTALLMFEFPVHYNDDYCSNCYSLLVSTAGKNYVAGVNYLGKSISPDNALKVLSPLAEIS
ncbi:hypothetical protein MMP66_18040 [Acinetobacter dispersus]|uniref:hypothetical protein n=1 Tax=Acinetobacter dispersus TaxID=70348 RepID=UPI001F4AE2D4|nr:hypothetical protein [Acinetobacter dispersus]MCH7396151.1 hypothetical protein [Acinetobacter dispersus]